MGTRTSDNALSYLDNMVKLNVYDLSEQNNVLYWCGFGVFHTGVEVYGVEYAYGGHEYEASGIFATEPKKPPGPVEYRESILMGETPLSPVEIGQLITKMGYYYKGSSYHLLQRNCNHFASDLTKELVGKRAPSWINRLAGLAVLCHCLIPASWVPPLTTPSQMQIDDSHKVIENKNLLGNLTSRSDKYQEEPKLASEEQPDLHVSQRSNGFA